MFFKFNKGFLCKQANNSMGYTIAGETGHIELLNNLFQSEVYGWGRKMIELQSGRYTKIAVVAARYGHHKIIRELVKAGIDLEGSSFETFGYFRKIMPLEIGKELLEVVLRVIETTEATIDCRRWWNVDSLEDVLHEAVKRQNEKAVNQMIAAGIHLTRQNP